MNSLPVRFLSVLSLPVLFLLASCRAPEQTSENKQTTRFPNYRPDPVNQKPSLTDQDHDLAKQIQTHQTEDVTPLKEIERQSDVVRYIESLDATAPSRKVSATGKTIANNLYNQSIPQEHFGRWYRLRGTPISKPDDDPYRGHLDTDVSVQQFTMKNPADYDAPEHTMYYVIVSLEDLPTSKPEDTILEMDGLLWTTWDLSRQGPARTGDTPQTALPVLFVKNYRIVKQ
jgi:hypothetical protein